MPKARKKPVKPVKRAPAKPKTKPKPKEKPKMAIRKSDDEAPAPAPAEKPADNSVKPDDLKTEQEKGKPDPVSPAEPSPGPVKTIEEEGIGSRQPYPTKEG